MKRIIVFLAAAAAAGAAEARLRIVTDEDTKLPLPAVVYSGVLVKGDTGEMADFGPAGTKANMRFEAHTDDPVGAPLWFTNVSGVAVSTCGTFQVTLSDEKLGWLLATGDVTRVGFRVEGASEILPRREILPIAVTARAHTADEAAEDMSVGTMLTDGITAAGWFQASRLVATGTLEAVTAGGLTVKPFAVGPGESTTLMRGKGFTTLGAKPVRVFTSTGARVARGEVLWTATGDGIAVVHCTSSGEERDELRVPAVSQFCKTGDVVRSPTSVAGMVSVTFHPFSK